MGKQFFDTAYNSERGQDEIVLPPAGLDQVIVDVVATWAPDDAGDRNQSELAALLTRAQGVGWTAVSVSTATYPRTYNDKTEFVYTVLFHRTNAAVPAARNPNGPSWG